jgi:hypothetical protein
MAVEYVKTASKYDGRSLDTPVVCTLPGFEPPMCMFGEEGEGGGERGGEGGRRKEEGGRRKEEGGGGRRRRKEEGGST